MVHCSTCQLYLGSGKLGHHRYCRYDVRRPKCVDVILLRVHIIILNKKLPLPPKSHPRAGVAIVATSPEPHVMGLICGSSTQIGEPPLKTSYSSWQRTWQEAWKRGCTDNLLFFARNHSSAFVLWMRLATTWDFFFFYALLRLTFGHTSYPRI